MRFTASPCQPEPDSFCVNLPRCTKEQLACRAFASFIASDIGGRWRALPRRNPTREQFDAAHAEKSIDERTAWGARKSAVNRAQQTEALAVSLLMPLVEAGRRFASLTELSKSSGIHASRLGNWRKRYYDAAVLIQKLLAPE